MTVNTKTTKEKISLGGIITIALLLTLVCTNAFWLIISWNGGPLIALVFYLVISFRCLKGRHFYAGIIAGILGVGIHIFELFAYGIVKLTEIDQVFFCANLILPIPLIYTSYLASRKKLH